MTQKQIRQRIAQIAKQQLHIKTLEVRGSDSLDFHDLKVSLIEQALIAAFEAGMASK